MQSCAPPTLPPDVTYTISRWEGTNRVIIVTLWGTIGLMHIVGVT